MKLLPFRPFIKIYISLFVFALVILGGALGYMYLESYSFLEAVYMTVITISTVGYSETKPLDNPGRIFTIVLILANILTFTYFIAHTSAYFLDGEFSRVYKIYKMRNLIGELREHVVICGFGRNGKEAAKILDSNQQKFVVIEKTASRRDNLSFEVLYYIEDDATQDEVLLEAGIKNAAALISTLPDDADNLFVVLTAHELNPNLKIISRASNDSSVRKLKTAGANNVIMPDKIGGAHMANLVLSPDVKEFVDLMATQRNEHFSIEEIKVERGISLKEFDCWNNTGATVLGIKSPEGEFALNPTSETIAKQGSRVIVMGSKEQLKKAASLLA